MSINENATFQEWRPAAGSELHRAIDAQIAAAGELEYMQQVVADLRGRRQTAQATADAIDWRADPAPTVAAISVLPVIATQIAAAEKDTARAENKLRLATKQVDTIAANLTAALQRVQTYEQLLIDLPGRVTDSDRRKLEEARQEFTRLSSVLLAK